MIIEIIIAFGIGMIVGFGIQHLVLRHLLNTQDRDFDNDLKNFGLIMYNLGNISTKRTEADQDEL